MMFALGFALGTASGIVLVLAGIYGLFWYRALIEKDPDKPEKK